MSVVIEYPIWRGNIICRPCGSSDFLRQKENDFHSPFYTYWFTDILDTLVVMWFLFKLVFHFLSRANKLPLLLFVLASVCMREVQVRKCLFTALPQESSSCFGLDLKAQWVLWNLGSAWFASAASHSGSAWGTQGSCGNDCWSWFFFQHGFWVVLSAPEKRVWSWP